jgi:hypothetical protein
LFLSFAFLFDSRGIIVGVEFCVLIPHSLVRISFPAASALMVFVGFACKCFSFRSYESVPRFTGFWPILSARNPFINNTSEISIR